MGAAEAKAMNDRQKRYDLLHHQMRVAHFQAQPKLDSLQFSLLRDSLAILADPSMASRSVDLNDLEYLAELDAFAAPEKIAAE